MFFNADDDDDFSPSFSAGGSKSNLSSLFGADQAAFNSSSNEKLTYTAPKQPKKQASGGQDAPPAVIHAVAAQAFKFVNGQYASQGKLGVAVLGSHVKKEYYLLVYASKKQQVTRAKITNNFSFVVQGNNYSSFYDDTRLSWSLRFDSLQSMTDFAKHVGLARYNSAPGNLIKQDLQPGDGQEVENGDAIEVKYTGSLWSNHSFGKVFDSNAAADKLFKFRPGKGKVIKGWEDGVLGMKKGGKRLLAIPPELAYGEKGVPSRVPPRSTLLFEVEISRVKFSKERTDTVSSDTSTPPSVNEQTHKDELNSSTNSGHSREDEDHRERTTSLSKELSTSPEKGSEKAKLLARMSKMGKNVLKLPGAVAADPEEYQHESAEAVSENVGGHTSARSQAEPVLERTLSQSHENHDPSGNPHPHSPGKPPVARRSAHVNRIAHAATLAHGPSHVTHTQAPPQYHAEYQNPSPVTHTPMPPQQQALALYQTPLQQTPPLYQQPAQYTFPQPQPAFQPVYQQPPQPVFQPAPAVQPPPTPSSSGGTSDVMMPVLMSETRQHQTEVRQAITKVSEKIDSLEHKIDVLKQSNTENNGAIRPAVSGLSNENIMEASVLMNSIVKLVQDNERMKRENVEKTAKVEGLNEKISELLHRSQKYVEQSNIFLERRNESLQQTTSYSQSKLVELEREKATLSTELGAYKQNFATIETELEILRKQDAENRELLKKTSSQLQKHKTELGTTKEALTEREEEVEKLSLSVKNLKQERKKVEGSLISLEDTVSDLRQEKESLEKNLADRKKKQAEVKKRMDEEIEELKSSNEEELNSLKERHRRELTSSSSSLSQQISELESEMETKWQGKSTQLVNQCDKKWQRKYDDLVEECDALKKRISESDEKYSSIKTSQVQHLQKVEDLQEKLKDFEETRSKYASIKNSHNEQQRELKDLREKVREMENTQKKYQDLRMRSIEMKEKYEQRFQEMAKEKVIAVKELQQRIIDEKQEAAVQQQAAGPPRDTIVNEVKQIMNKVFFKIREEFVAGDSYQGSAIIAVVLNVIKTMTLKMTSGVEEEESDDESGEEESEEEEGEISEEDKGESEKGDGDESGKEETVKKESGKVEDEESEEEKAENGENLSEKMEDGEIEEEEKVNVQEEGSGENSSGKVKDEESKEDETENVEEEGSGENSSGKVEENESEQEKLKSEVKEDIEDEVPEDKVNHEEEKDKVEETQEMNEHAELEQTNRREESITGDGNDKGGTSTDTDGEGGKTEEPEGLPKISVDVVESPLHHTNYSDDEYDEDLENRGIDEVPPIEDVKESDDNLGVVEDNASSEGNLDDISNKAQHGSEQDASISSEEENVGDNNEQDEDEQGLLVSDLPNVDELSNTSKDVEDTSEGSGNQGESVDNKRSDSEVESKGESENHAEAGIGGEKTAKNEAKVDIAKEEKSKEENKVQSLSDFLSDDEDDVQGLFDIPAPKKIPTPAKKEEGAKEIPPPLFDDDDDDDLDWFS